MGKKSLEKRPLNNVKVYEIYVHVFHPCVKIQYWFFFFLVRSRKCKTLVQIRFSLIKYSCLWYTSCAFCLYSKIFLILRYGVGILGASHLGVSNICKNQLLEYIMWVYLRIGKNPVVLFRFSAGSCEKKITRFWIYSQ